MRSWVTFIFLTLSACTALAGNEAPAPLCSAEKGWCMPPQHGTCEHPKLILEREYLQYEGTPTSHSYERKCILRAKSFALRRGGELRLIFGNGTTKAYKDSSSKACEQGPYESCKQYLLYDF